MDDNTTEPADAAALPLAGIRVIELSATKGQGMAEWLAWIDEGVRTTAAARAECVQPFCLAMRGVLPPEPVGPAPSA